MYLLKIANILIPLFLLPYLVKVLGVEKYGLVIFAQVFANFFTMFVDFGLTLCIVPIVSANSESKNKLSEIFGSVLTIRFLMSIIAFLIYLLIILNFSKFSSEFKLFFLMFGIVIGQAFFPLWFFQGMRKMKFIAILNFISRLFAALFIVLLIKNSSDYLLYPIIVSIGYFSILPIAYYIIFKNFKIKPYFPKFNIWFDYLKMSSHFFISRVAKQLYEGGGVFIAGIVTTPQMLGYYTIADKLRSAILGLYGPVSQVLYPYVAKYKNLQLYKKLYLIINIISLIALGILYIYTKEITEMLFHTSNAIIITIMHIFILLLVLDINSILLGFPLLGAMGHTHYINYGLVLTLVSFILIMLLFYISDNLNIYTIAISYTISIFIELLYRMYGVVKFEIFKKGKL